MNNLSAYIPNIIFGYLKSFILSWVVLPTTGAILFIFTAFPDAISVWVKHVPYLNNWLFLLQGTFDGRDILKLFGVASLVLYLFIELLKLTSLKFTPSFKRGVLFLSIIFGTAILLALYPTRELNLTGAESGFVFIFIIFWIITIIAYRLWYFLNMEISQHKIPGLGTQGRLDVSE